MWNMHIRGEGQKFTNVDEMILSRSHFVVSSFKDIQHVSGFLYHDSQNYEKVTF